MHPQVSLGDFACAKKASKGIMAGAVRCVAAWAVEACPVVKCLWREEKQSGTHVRKPADLFQAPSVVARNTYFVGSNSVLAEFVLNFGRMDVLFQTVTT